MTVGDDVQLSIDQVNIDSAACLCFLHSVSMIYIMQIIMLNLIMETAGTNHILKSVRVNSIRLPCANQAPIRAHAINGNG